MLFRSGAVEGDAVTVAFGFGERAVDVPEQGFQTCHRELTVPWLSAWWLAVIELGGGRRVAADKIDHAVGLTALAGKAASVDKSRPLAIIRARDEVSFERAQKLVRAAYVLGKPKCATPCVIERIGK